MSLDDWLEKIIKRCNKKAVDSNIVSDIKVIVSSENTSMEVRKKC
jgi:hypothetical protein